MNSCTFYLCYCDKQYFTYLVTVNGERLSWLQKTRFIAPLDDLVVIDLLNVATNGAHL